MSPRRRFRERPPWWPANEPWPPRRHFGRGYRRRFGCLFAAALACSAMAAMATLSITLGPSWAGTARVPAIMLMAAVTLIALYAVFLGSMRRFGFPFADIVEAADRVASGDFSMRLDERGPPSLRSVARAFNSMTARLQTQEEQRRRFMTDVAHELRTPLTVLQGRIEGLLDGIYPRDDQRLGDVLADARLVARLVEDLQTLASAESGTLTLQKEPTDLAVLAQDVVNAFASNASANGVVLRADVPSHLPPADVDPLRIRQVLINLVSNALRHTPPGGSVTLSAAQAGSRITIAATDTGSGIPPDELPKIFDRFFKGAMSRGSGLGLTIARNLIEAHGGDIRADSSPDRGTTITVTLPF